MNKRSLNMRILWLGVLVSLLIAPTILFAEEATSDGMEGIEAAGFGYIDGDYPGWNTSHDFFYHRSDSMVRWGLFYYYRIYGTWPDTWQAVVDEGIYQAPLTGFSNDNIVTPDDPVMRFAGDCYYDVDQAGDTARVSVVRYLDGMHYEFYNISPPKRTYDEFLPLLDETLLRGTPTMVYYLDDINWLRFFAIMGMIDKCISDYKILHGDFPHDWAEFMASGLAPIDENSVNPLTGGSFFGDARSNDFGYTYMPAKDDHPAYYLLIPVKADGTMLEARFSY